MKKIFQLVLIIAFSAGFTGCDEDDDNMCPPTAPTAKVKVSFIPTWNGTPVEDGAEYDDHLGNSLLQFNFKAFISNLKLANSDSETELSEVELLALGDGPIELVYDVPANSEFTSFLMHTGVPPEYNVDYDPTSWPNTHPLSIQGAQGMHWGWNTGYIFTKFDGKADTLGTAQTGYLYPFSYHAGADDFYTPHSFAVNVATQVNDTAEITMNIAMEMMLNSEHSIDIREDAQTHTGGNFSLAQKFTDNFNQCFSIE